MAAVGQQGSAATGLEGLLSLLEHDPNNLALISDAASAAYAEGDLSQASGLIERFGAQAPLSLRLRNLKGMIALSGHRFDEAAATFEALLAQSPSDPALRFNLAWSKAMLGDFAAASDLIDEATAAAAPGAALLKIRALHHLGRPREALEIGRTFAASRPGDQTLMGALASAALDSEEPELARQYALQAPGAGDGLAALGMLELNDLRPAEAAPLFMRALEAEPQNPRAWLGEGLVALTASRPAEAAKCLDHAAELFRRHLGSWVAAGWAHLLAGDRALSRARFERALELDANFAEAQGGLAVIDLLDGRIDEGLRRTQVALRLDRNCLAAALASSLLLASRGDQASAQKVLELAQNAPIGPGGRSILQTMGALGFGVPGRKPPTG